MFLWRISNHTTLDGGGGLLAGARWHFAGQPVVYLAETPAGSLLEILVHLELDLASLPRTFKLLKLEVPASVDTQSISESTLTAGWTNDPDATAEMGSQWLASKKSALLRVPSAIVPETHNYLLNPRHDQASKIKVLWNRDYPWDKRLLS
jgi:RES domain-containing protein